MAKMYPRVIRETTESDAERLLFREFEEQLPDSYIVFHSVGWHQLDRRGFNKDREADFVIVDPSRGILVLEVKGGRIWKDGATGQYYSNNNPLKEDPFEQAQRNMYDLTQWVKGAPSTCRWASSFRLQHAVAFPQSLITREIATAMPLPRSQVMDSSNLADLSRWIENALGHADPRWALGPEARNALVKLVAPSSDPAPLGLLAQIKEQNPRFEALTETQQNILASLEEWGRLAVAGCAGSGKTFLAMEQTHRLVRQGQRVLFTCHNRALADWVCDRLQRSLGDSAGLLHVDEFDGVALDFCRRFDADMPDPERLPLDQKGDFYNVMLPQALDEVTKRIPESEKFDAIIVDEAQDFQILRWGPLLELLRDPTSGRLYIFYDSNQNLFVPEVDFPIPKPHYRLDRNCRNTQAIHQLAAEYHSDPRRLECLGPAGSKPEVIDAEPGKEKSELRRVLGELKTHGIAPSQIVVLTPRSNRSSVFKEGEDAGNGLALTWKKPGPRQVAIRNVHAYKGLESDIAIVVEPTQIRKEQVPKILYVAFSRARHHLYVIGKLPQAAVQLELMA